MNQPVITKSAMEDLQLGKNGSYSNEGNVLQHTLYDTLAFQATTMRPQTIFFNTGQTATRTLTETNLQEAGKLPNGQTFLIKGMSLALIAGFVGADTDVNTILSAYYNIIQNSTFEIKIAGREWDLQKPGTSFLPPVVNASLNSAANGAFPQGQFITTGACKLNATPIPIGQLVSFQVFQKSGSGTGAITAILNTASDVLATQNAQLQVRLEGVLTRAI